MRHRLVSRLALAFWLTSVAGATQSQQSTDTDALTDTEIRLLIIRDSIAAYGSVCACPYNSDRAGRACGSRAAYGKPGGSSPLCFETDVAGGDGQAISRAVDAAVNRGPALDGACQ